MTKPYASPRTIVLERAGCNLHAWFYGEEPGPVVILVHGATMDRRMFDDQLDPLISAGYRVLTLDLRGHGRSKPIGRTDISIPDLTDDVLALAGSVGAERFIVIGQSLGGYVAQDLVLRYPERVIALGVIGSTCTTATVSALAGTLLKQSPLWFTWWPYGHLKKTMAKTLAHSPRVRAYAAKAMDQLSNEEFLAIWRAVSKALTPRPGYRIEHPILITHGDDDRTGDIRRAAAPWARRDPRSTYVVIPNARHNANQDNPVRYNAALMAFLAEAAPIGDPL